MEFKNFPLPSILIFLFFIFCLHLCNYTVALFLGPFYDNCYSANLDSFRNDQDWLIGFQLLFNWFDRLFNINKVFSLDSSKFNNMLGHPQL